MEKKVKAWNPKGGRPTKPENELRKHQVLIKFTEDEKKQLYQECRDLGWEYPIVYFRKKLLSKEGGIGHNPKVLFHAMDKLGAEMKKVGVNINQVARYVNYLDRNNIIEPKFIADYNEHFALYLKLQQEYIKAIRSYLKSNKKARLNNNH